MTTRHKTCRSAPASPLRTAIEGVTFLALCAITAFSAVLAKDASATSALSPLASIDQSAPKNAEVSAASYTNTDDSLSIIDPIATDPTVTIEEVELDAAHPIDTRWFNGRPVRPVKKLIMTVTAYSPDHRSCGNFADGITASLHSVGTNNGHLVAADSTILPLGSLIVVPGYANNEVVPVLDRGGAIKGHRLDVLYPTHRTARQWGVQKLEVLVYDYVDGKAAPDFRAIRDSRQ